MKLMTIPAAAVAATFVFAQSAHAREYHRYHGLHRVAYQHMSRAAAPFGQQQDFTGGFWNGSEEAAYPTRRRNRPAQDSADGFWSGSEEAAYPARRRNRPAQEFAGGSWNSPETSAYHGSVGARPAAWCGWEMRQLVGGDPGPEYNLARNWAHWGHAGPAGVGAVVVWAHHVGKIVGQQNGQWIIESGNDGHAVRTRPLSVAGAIAFRWG
jgi:hypothetical protein